MPTGRPGIPPFLSSRHRPRPDDDTHPLEEVLNRAAGIFRMAGHMLGDHLLLFRLHRGLVVCVIDDDAQMGKVPPRVWGPVRPNFAQRPDRPLQTGRPGLVTTHRRGRVMTKTMLPFLASVLLYCSRSQRRTVCERLGVEYEKVILSRCAVGVATGITGG